jgi:hypothetical protein
MTGSLHLRHHDADLDGFAARVVDLLLGKPPVLVDLSGHDERCDRIDLRTHDLAENSDDAAR